jgi:signal-transduction protein with cAMP-binding, CBS, and nucleotidyltransferase domain
LASDISEEKTLRFLKVCQQDNDAFSMFGESDLEKFAKVLSVLSFDPGEKIIAKGENASFCGIILDGVFNAVVNENLTVPLKKGAILGEMAYFEYIVDPEGEHSLRTADIVSDSEVGVCVCVSVSVFLCVCVCLFLCVCVFYVE